APASVAPPPARIRPAGPVPVTSTFLAEPATQPKVGPKLFDRSEVDSLLETFEVSGDGGDKQVARELKAMVGLEATPPLPDSESLTELMPAKHPAPSAPTDPVEALLAMSDSGPEPNKQRGVAMHTQGTMLGLQPQSQPPPPNSANPVDALLAA